MSLFTTERNNFGLFNQLTASSLAAEQLSVTGDASVDGMVNVGQLVASTDVTPFTANPPFSPVSLTTLVSLLTSAPSPNTPVYSLPAGVPGQLKILIYNAATGSTAVEVSIRCTGLGFNNVTLAVRGRSAILLYTANGWVLIGGNAPSLSNVV
jgi:hypothetical protein